MKAAVVVLSAFIAAGLSSPVCAQENKLVRNFAGGVAPTSVGVVPGGEDSEDDGPQAIYAGDKGEIYLLDQINGRILQVDPTDPGKEPQVLTLPDGMQATDIVVANNTIYAWDGQIRALQPTGSENARTRGLTLTRSIVTGDEAVTNAFAQMGSEAVSGDDSAGRGIDGKGTTRRRQTIASRGRGKVSADFASVANDAGVEITIRGDDASRPATKLKLQVRSKLGGVELLEVDKQGRAFVFAENVPTDLVEQASSFVARYSPTGGLEGIHELPLNSSVALSRRFVTVSPEGDVYFLRNRAGQTDVLGVGFRALKNATVIDTGTSRPSVSLSSLARLKGANAAVRPLTRAQVLETARAFADVRWRVNAGAYGSDPDTVCSGFDRVRRPGYISGRVNQEVQGFPYCWGCMGSLPQIASNIERGMKAGNICTRNNPRPDVTGVDCSAFVSATWGLSTHFTTIAIPSIAKQLANPFDLLPGDALNKPGSHVMLFVRFTPDKKAEVIESSTGGCNGKVCRNVYPIGSLLGRGYQPVRYRGLANDMSTPAMASTKPDPAPGKGAPPRR